jgi:hypothetical protein
MDGGIAPGNRSLMDILGIETRNLRYTSSQQTFDNPVDRG